MRDADTAFDEWPATPGARPVENFKDRNWAGLAIASMHAFSHGAFPGER